MKDDEGDFHLEPLGNRLIVLATAALLVDGITRAQALEVTGPHHVVLASA